MFFVTGLPRSRTSWFSLYLDCEHDLLGRVTRAQFYEQMPRLNGLSDSGLMFTDFQDRWDAPTVIIERDPFTVMQSMAALGGIPQELMDDGLHRLSKLKGLRVGFHEIDGRLKEITEYLGVRWDAKRAERYKRMTVTPRIEQSEIDVIKEWF